jgi:hypothetical protein
MHRPGAARADPALHHQATLTSTSDLGRRSLSGISMGFIKKFSSPSLEY